MAIPADFPGVYLNVFQDHGSPVEQMPAVTVQEASTGNVNERVMKVVDAGGIVVGFTFKVTDEKPVAGLVDCASVIQLFMTGEELAWNAGGWKTHELFHTNIKQRMRWAAEDAEAPDPFVGGREAMTPECIAKLFDRAYVWHDHLGEEHTIGLSQ